MSYLIRHEKKVLCDRRAPSEIFRKGVFSLQNSTRYCNGRNLHLYQEHWRLSTSFGSPKMGEATILSVHRCRFVDFDPSAITALAFPPLPLPSLKGKKPASEKKFLSYGTLAVGRANGNIDLSEWTGGERQHQSAQAWVVRKVKYAHFHIVLYLTSSPIDTVWPVPLQS